MGNRVRKKPHKQLLSEVENKGHSFDILPTTITRNKRADSLTAVFGARFEVGIIRKELRIYQMVYLIKIAKAEKKSKRGEGSNIMLRFFLRKQYPINKS